MKLLIIADIDDFHWKNGTGQADVLLSCGDVSDQVILEASQSYGCSLILAVKGNHDSIAPFAEPIVDLHLEIVKHAGVNFGGLNGSCKYKPRGHFLYEQREVEQYLSSFPPVDVFVSHNSPRGIHDRDDEVHHGFDGLRSYIARAQPKIVVHGHQHVATETQVGETKVFGIYGCRVIEL